MSTARHLSLPALLLALALAAPPAVAQELAVYKGAGCDGKKRIADFEQWLGRRVDRVLDFVARDSWDKMVHSTRWISGCWRGAPYKLTLSLPMVPNGKDNRFADGAAGAYDRTFRQIAETLVADGHADTIIRLGWEFNGGWYPWAAKRDPKNWPAYWRRIVTVMRAVPGARFRFDWNPTLGWEQVPPDTVYPGDAFVDIIGLDVYNQTWKKDANTPERRWTHLMKQSFGLKWHAEFARKHGKPMSFPEWGTGTRPDGHGGGDDPLFVERMSAWIKQNDVLYQGYWDFPAADFNAEVSKGKLPEAGAALRRQFGSGG